MTGPTDPRPDPRPDQQPERWSAGAEGYDAAFAPFTGRYADDAVRRCAIGPGTRVLDVAAGTGAFALRAAEAGGDVLATDFAPGMVELLRRRFAERDLDARAEVMDGQALDVADASVDVAASMFGVIFFPDQRAGFAELARAVVPGGRVLVATWLIESFRLSALVTEALTRAVPGFEPPGGPPPWASLGTPEGLEAELVAVGLEPDLEVVHHHWVIPDPEAFFRSQPRWSPPAQLLFSTLDDATIDRGATAFAEVVAEHDDGAGIGTAALLGVGHKR